MNGTLFNVSLQEVDDDMRGNRGPLNAAIKELALEEEPVISSADCVVLIRSGRPTKPFQIKSEPDTYRSGPNSTSLWAA